MAAVHIIGAGLAGLSCALRLAQAGWRVTVHEAARHAGGRCRSFYDPQIDRTLDNGSHLILSGNRETSAFLRQIGAEDSLSGPERAAFPFFDLRTDRRHVLRPNTGPIPWWVLAPGRRVPGIQLSSYASAFRLLSSPAGATVAECLVPDHPLFPAFWKPLTLAVLNAAPDVAAASLLKSVFRQTFVRGGQACRPLVARESLSATFIDPAVNTLRSMSVTFRVNSPLRQLTVRDGSAVALIFSGETLPVGDDWIVLAVPPTACRKVLPEVTTPIGDSPILNAHFAVDAPNRDGEPAFVGLLNGCAHWAFRRDGVISATISAASAAAKPTEAVAAALWRDVCRPFGLQGCPLPPYRLVREKRATFLQTPENEHRRPGPRTGYRNLLLAGDWTDTGLPATIEGAILSGYRAADAALGRLTRMKPTGSLLWSPSIIDPYRSRAWRWRARRSSRSLRGADHGTTAIPMEE